MQYIRDFAEDLELKDILSRQNRDWQDVPDAGYHFGTVREPIWLRIKFQNDRGTAAHYRIRFIYNFIDYIEVYDRSGVLYRTGLKEGLASRVVFDNHFSFPVNLQPNSEKIYYYRVDTRTAFSPAAELYPADQHGFMLMRKFVYFVVYGSFALAFFVYNMLIYIHIRMKVYLYYSLFVIFFFLYQFFLEGFGYILIHDSHGFNQSMVHTLPQVALFFHILYTLDIISLKKDRPNVYQFYRYLKWILFVSIPFYFAGFFYIERLILPYLNSAIFLSFLPLGIDAFQRRPEVGRVFLLGWLVFILGMLTYGGIITGILPFTERMISIVFFANIVEILTLSWTLSIKLREVANSQEEQYHKVASISEESGPVKATPVKKPYSIGFNPSVLKQQLDSLMESEQLYRSESLRLDYLAENLGVTRYQLSAFFNEYLETTYHNYLTGLRTAHARGLMQDHPDYDLLHIAFESGFSSKSTFYTAFKNIHGISPGQYRRRMADE